MAVVKANALVRVSTTGVALAVFLGALPLKAAPSEKDGYPAVVGERVAQGGIVVADLDGGNPEIIVAIKGGVAAFSHDGKPLAGFPVSLTAKGASTGVQFSASPAVCDLDGDSRKEIILAGTGKTLFALTASGGTARGFPVALDGNVRGGVTCYGAGPGRLANLALATDAGSVVTVSGSGGQPKKIGKVGKGVESGVSVADIDGDRSLDFVVAGGKARLHVLSAKGKNLEGFPYKTSFRASGVPAIGDINDDGRPDIVFGAQDFKIHAVDYGGKPLPGFPVDTSYRIYSGVALADISGDGVLDVVASSADKKLYVVDGQGKPLRGFPVTMDGRGVAAPVVGDLDKDGDLDIVSVSQGGSIYVVNKSGKALRGFPTRLGGKPETSAAIADLDGDGEPEVVAVSPVGQLHAYRFKARGKAKIAMIPWGMAGQNPSGSARYGPNPGRFKELRFKGSGLKTSDALDVRYRFFDLDGDSESETQIRWYLDGKLQTDLNNARTISAERTKKHQKWKYTLQEGANFKAFGEKGRLSKVFESPVVEIANSLAVAPSVKLGPPGIKTTQTLEVKILEPSVDADGDRIEYRKVWLRNGELFRTKSSTTQIPAAQTKKSDEWKVVVVPYDGEEEGAKATDSIVIENTAPSAPVIAHEPSVPGVEDTIKVLVKKPASDPDKDALRYVHRYSVGQTPLVLAGDSGQVPPGTLRKHDKVKVEVTAWDDEVAGGRVETMFEVKNTPPEAPVVAIGPVKARTTDVLRLAITKPARDADGDPVTLKHQWMLNGKPVTHPTRVDAQHTKKGQVWSVSVVPSDGEVDGAKAVAKLTVLNTPPTRPKVTLDAYTKATDEPVEPRIVTASTDVDGDTVRLKYQWTRDGKSAGVPETKTKLEPNDTRKGQRWLLRVVPHDGEADGLHSTVAFQIMNSPPTAPEVALAVPDATALQKQAVKVTKPATDKDGDRLVYHYRWYRNGRVMPWAKTKGTIEPREAKKHQHWRVEVRAFDGETEGPPASASFRVRNHVPGAPKVVVGPPNVRTTQAIECRVTAAGVDPDGDRVTHLVQWFLNDVPVDLPQSATKVPASLTREKQKWRCEVRASDGELQSAVSKSSPLTVGNSVPSAPVVRVWPSQPTTVDDLVCEMSTPSKDADLDPVSYSYSWRVGNKSYRGTGATTSTIPAANTKRDQTWQCAIVASDGESKAPASVAGATVANTAPTTPKVHIVPAQPGAGTKLTCKIRQPATDADKDRVRYRYAWLRDGVKQNFAPTSTSVPGRLVKKRDLWKCTVTASDGKAESRPAESSEVVVAE